MAFRRPGSVLPFLLSTRNPNTDKPKITRIQRRQGGGRSHELPHSELLTAQTRVPERARLARVPPDTISSCATLTQQTRGAGARTVPRANNQIGLPALLRVVSSLFRPPPPRLLWIDSFLCSAPAWPLLAKTTA